MSASIDYVRFCEYFDDCPRIDCPGKVYDVEEYYRPINEEEEASDNESDYLCSSSENNSTHRDFSKTFRSIADQERSLVEHAIEVLFQDIICAEREEGDVLIFFSGSREILECTDAINKRSRSENQAVVAYPLFSSMNEDEKTASKDPSHRSGLDEEKAPTTKYVRKVICCTNICETSLTIGNSQ
jgi:ATP-dependent helicase HrpA